MGMVGLHFVYFLNKRVDRLDVDASKLSGHAIVGSFSCKGVCGTAKRTDTELPCTDRDPDADVAVADRFHSVASGILANTVGSWSLKYRMGVVFPMTFSLSEFVIEDWRRSIP